MKLEETECTFKDRTVFHDEEKSIVRFTIDDNVIGKLDLNINDNRACFINDFEIEPKYRKSGLGKCLYEFSEEFYLEDDCDTIEIASMPAKVGFWLKMGFDLDASNPEEGMTVPMIKELSDLDTGLWL